MWYISGYFSNSDKTLIISKNNSDWLFLPPKKRKQCTILCQGTRGDWGQRKQCTALCQGMREDWGE